MTGRCEHVRVRSVGEQRPGEVGVLEGRGACWADWLKPARMVALRQPNFTPKNRPSPSGTITDCRSAVCSAASRNARIATAVSEIARNAYRYAGGGKVEFRLEGESAPQLMLVRIKDEGPGIPDLDKVMSGGYRSQTGMGIGIIAKKKPIAIPPATVSRQGCQSDRSSRRLRMPFHHSKRRSRRCRMIRCTFRTRRR